MATEGVEAWLQAPPRNRTVRRDRRGILPAAPDYYDPIARGITTSAAFVLLLSQRWLSSRVAAREFSDAIAAGKKIVPVVHPAIPRDPMQEEGRKNKAELMEAFANFEHRETLEPFNWIWTLATESSQLALPCSTRQPRATHCSNSHRFDGDVASVWFTRERNFSKGTWADGLCYLSRFGRSSSSALCTSCLASSSCSRTSAMSMRGLPGQRSLWQ